MLDFCFGGGGATRPTVNNMEPSTTSTGTRLIGQEGHDGDSDWDRLSAKYCGFIVGHIERNCGGWGDLGIEAFEDAVERVRKKGGLDIKDYRKGMFRKALIRLSRDMLSVMGRRRDRRCKREREIVEGMRVLRQPSRPSGLSDEEIALRGLRFRICRELLSGDYRNTDLADKFTPDEEVKVILWRHAVLKKLSREDDRGEVAETGGISEEEIDRCAAEETGAKPWVVTRAKQEINAKIDRLAAEELVRRIGGCGVP